MLKLVHGQEAPNYEELLHRKQDLQKIRDIAESSTFISTNAHKSNSYEAKDPRPSAATTNDWVKDQSFEIITDSKEQLNLIMQEEKKEDFL
jgi:hypothetical protein